MYYLRWNHLFLDVAPRNKPVALYWKPTSTKHSWKNQEQWSRHTKITVILTQRTNSKELCYTKFFKFSSSQSVNSPEMSKSIFYFSLLLFASLLKTICWNTHFLKITYLGWHKRNRYPYFVTEPPDRCWLHPSCSGLDSDPFQIHGSIILVCGWGPSATPVVHTNK